MQRKTDPVQQLYNQRWVGFIPFIGATVGMVFLWLGIFRYKSRKLILLGAASVLSTLIIYGTIYYYFHYSKAYRTGFSKYCQPTMDELVKSIEFYKVEKKQYPDNLDQLTDTSNVALIRDPIAQRDDDNKGQFYYLKMGERYTLFSSGIDRIPYNKDDIYPSERFFDRTKTGLIKP